jgi:hypothetical protein
MVKAQQYKAQQQRVKAQALALRNSRLVGQPRAPLSDVVSIANPAAFANWLLPAWAGRVTPVDLKATAKEIEEAPDPAKAEDRRALYGHAKCLAGFTPDEITKAVTRHGVSFDPSAVDPRYIAVFESRDQLEKAWNKGQPTDLFYQVGDAIDPQDKLTPAELYLAQLAVFSKK